MSDSVQLCFEGGLLEGLGFIILPCATRGHSSVGLENSKFDNILIFFNIFLK